jgi:uncharacterized protein YjiS (DUF1127 family)
MVQQGWDSPPHRRGASPAFSRDIGMRFQERRERERLRAVLYGLSDWELKDIGIARDQIDYVASNRGIDPRGI